MQERRQLSKKLSKIDPKGQQHGTKSRNVQNAANYSTLKAYNTLKGSQTSRDIHYPQQRSGRTKATSHITRLVTLVSAVLLCAVAVIVICDWNRAYLPYMNPPLYEWVQNIFCRETGDTSGCQRMETEPHATTTNTDVTSSQNDGSHKSSSHTENTAAQGKCACAKSGNGHRSPPASMNFSYFEWFPRIMRKINDPVNDTGFPYNRLDKLRPRSQFIDGLDIVAVELKGDTPTQGSHVRAYLLDDFLSTEECDALRHIHDSHVTSSVYPILCFATPETLYQHLKHLGRSDANISFRDFTKDTMCLNSSMSIMLREWGLLWSTSTCFYFGESVFSKVVDRRIEKVTGLKSVNGGAFRVVSYLQNVGYKEHTDCTSNSGTDDRYATILVYLDDVEIGGHTHFLDLGISVKPKKGRALVWNSMTKDGKCDHTSLHMAKPVIKGAKYILQRWYYYDNFPGVSTRPPVPSIPPRLPNQGMVSCDEYRNGSCRFYDSWTYNIVTRNWHTV